MSSVETWAARRGQIWHHRVVQLPAVLVRVIDPANGYFEKRRSPRRGGPIYRGGAVFGPGVPGGSRQATDDEIAEMQRRANAEPKRSRRELPPLERDGLTAAVTSLLDTGSAAIGEGPERCKAKIVRFWHGDSILEVSHRSGSSLTRIPRRPTSQDRATLFSVLAHHVADLTDE